MVMAVPFSEIAILIALGVVCAAIFGLAALWAASGPVGHLGRWTPLVLLLAATAPIGAYELSAMFGVQAAIVTVGITLVRFVSRRFAKPNPHNSTQPSIETSSSMPRLAAARFRMVDLLKAVLLAAAMLAIVRNAAPSSAASLGPIDWTPWIVAGVAAGGMTLAAAWLVGGTAWFPIRAVGFLVVTAAGALLLSMLYDDSNSATQFYHLEGIAKAWNLLAASAFSVGIALVLLAARAAGWNFWPCDAAATDVDARLVPCTQPIRSIWHWSARGALAAFLALSMLVLAPPYRALLPPAMPEPEPLPANNGYDDLERAAAKLNWTSIPSEEVETASPQQCAAFLQYNTPALSQMRDGLARECRLQVDYTMVGFNGFYTDVSSMRSLCRALQAEAKVAADQGRFDDVAHSCLDMHRLANALSTGGLEIHDLVGDVIAGVGSSEIAQHMHDFDEPTLAMISEHLRQAIDARVPLEQIERQELLWQQLATGWQGRLWGWIEGGASPWGMFDSAEDARKRVEAHARLLIAESAVRRQVLMEGSPPDTLAELVPAYLSAVPQDPYSNEPLVYRRTPDGYLLYSVGSNRIDDGGQRVSRQEATTEGKGDYFFDAVEESDESGGDAAESTPVAPAEGELDSDRGE